MTTSQRSCRRIDYSDTIGMTPLNIARKSRTWTHTPLLWMGRSRKGRIRHRAMEKMEAVHHILYIILQDRVWCTHISTQVHQTKELGRGPYWRGGLPRPIWKHTEELKNTLDHNWRNNAPLQSNRASHSRHSHSQGCNKCWRVIMWNIFSLYYFFLPGTCIVATYGYTGYKLCTHACMRVYARRGPKALRV